MKIIIKKGDTREIAPHFTAGEFFSKQPGRHAITEHDFYSELVEAVAYLRNHYGVPWRITSTYRPDSPGSQHRECRAVDSQDTKSGAGHGSPIMLDLVAQLLDSTSEVFVQLRRLGIRGFGVYDSFVHLDCRLGVQKHSDKFGTFAFWDNRTNSDEQPKKKALTKLAPVKKPNPPKAPAPVLRTTSGSSLASPS